MAVLHMAKCGKCIESLLGRELPEWQIPAYVREACLEKTLKDCTEDGSHVQAITCAPLPHTSVCSQLLSSVVETTWKVICASTVGPESLAFSMAAHESIWLCRARALDPEASLAPQEFFFLSREHVNKYRFNLLPAMASHPTPQHTPVSPGFSVLLLRALW